MCDGMLQSSFVFSDSSRLFILRPAQDSQGPSVKASMIQCPEKLTFATSE
jgi:hypothetical protein